MKLTWLQICLRHGRISAWGLTSPPPTPDYSLAPKSPFCRCSFFLDFTYNDMHTPYTTSLPRSTALGQLHFRPPCQLHRPLQFLQRNLRRATLGPSRPDDEDHTSFASSSVSWRIKCRREDCRRPYSWPQNDSERLRSPHASIGNPARRSCNRPTPAKATTDLRQRITCRRKAESVTIRE